MNYSGKSDNIITTGNTQNNKGERQPLELACIERGGKWGITGKGQLFTQVRILRHERKEERASLFLTLSTLVNDFSLFPSLSTPTMQMYSRVCITPWFGRIRTLVLISA